MAIELVTGYQGKDHVTAEQWADFNRGIFGEAAILPVGNRMETAIQTANQITVKDGVAVFDGKQVYIAYGESENIAIQSGTQGMQRRDIVVLEYKRNEESGVESVQFKVINGTPAASGAKDPSVQDMDIRTGVTVSQKPFCRVRLNGTAIEGVDALVQVKEFKPHAFAAPVNNLAGTNPDLALAAPQGSELKKQVDALNSALKPVEIFVGARAINVSEPWHNTLQFFNFSKIDMMITFQDGHFILPFYTYKNDNMKQSFSFSYFNQTDNKGRIIAGNMVFAGRYTDRVTVVMSYGLQGFQQIDASGITVNRIIGYY